MKTPEEMMADLKAMGVNLDSWGETTQSDAVLPTVDRQRAALEKLKGALEGMVAKDQATIDQLHEQMIRLQHGGGH